MRKQRRNRNNSRKWSIRISESKTTVHVGKLHANVSRHNKTLLFWMMNRKIKMISMFEIMLESLTKKIIPKNQNSLLLHCCYSWNNSHLFFTKLQSIPRFIILSSSTVRFFACLVIFFMPSSNILYLLIISFIFFPSSLSLLLSI